MFSNVFTPESWAEAVSVIKSEFLMGIWETFYVTVVSTFSRWSSACPWACCWWPGIRTACCRCPGP